MARPSKYKEEYNEQVYRLLLLDLNLGIVEIAFFFNVDVSDIEEWINKEPGFSRAVTRSKIDYPSHQKLRMKATEKRKKMRRSEKYRETNNEYQKNRLARSPKYRVRNNFATQLRHHLKNKSNKTFNSVGYSVVELMGHLEKKFNNGMTWDNYGSYWHIDHIRPVRSFNIQDQSDTEFKLCWGLDNLQPLTAIDNLKKGSKYHG